MLTLEFEIKGLPKMTNTLRVHWRVIQKERKRWKQLVAEAAVLEQKRAALEFLPLTKAQVTMTRFSTRQPDFDGLVSAGKAVLDGLVEAKILADDSPEVIGQPIYLWSYARPKEGKIKIKVEAA